jgi:hypothetical protein
MPLCLSCGKSEPLGVRICTRCNGSQFSNFRSSAVGLPKKDEQPANEPDFDISSVEQYLADVTHTGRISRSSKIEVRIEAIKRQIFKLYRKKRR